MLREKDLPCSDCGTQLVERTVEPLELFESSSIDGTIQLAECPECGARYFPDQSLSKLNARPDENQIEGEADSL